MLANAKYVVIISFKSYETIKQSENVMTLFTKAQIKEMNNTMHLASLFIDVNDREEVLKVIFNGVAFYGVKMTEAQKEEAFNFAKKY